MHVQLELFQLSAVACTGWPRPRPVAAEASDTDVPPTQVEELPFDDTETEAAA